MSPPREHDPRRDEARRAALGSRDRTRIDPARAGPLLATSPERSEQPAAGAPQDPALWGPASDPSTDGLDGVFEEFEARWSQGRCPRVEEFLARLPNPADAVALIYHDYCLACEAGGDPDPRAYLERYPAFRDRLTRVFGLHDLMPRDEDWTPQPAVASVDWPEVGDEVGDYRLIRVLGQGSWARVFLARETDLEDRPVVLKISRKPSLEPRILARVRHPHIVEVLFHRSTPDRSLYLVGMPYLGGATLARILSAAPGPAPGRRTGRDWLELLDAASDPLETEPAPGGPIRSLLVRMNWAKAQAWIIARLAEALAGAHRRGVIHGDLKPSNVLIAADGRPLLLDFHLAIGPDPTPGSDPGGTLAYMAPERLRAFATSAFQEPVPFGEAGAELELPGPSARPAGDLYALGLMLREALTGEPPYATVGQSSREPRALAALRSDPDWVRGFIGHPRIAPGLRPILARCLTPDWRQRYGQASELAADLDCWIADRIPTHAEPPPWPTRLAMAARRHRLTIIVSTLVALAALVASLAVRHLNHRRLEADVQKALVSLWSGSEPGVFRFRTKGHWSPVLPQEEVDASLRILAWYGVLEDPRWRERDTVRLLRPEQRADLELWLLEHLYRYASALDDRSEGKRGDDRKRAIEALDMVPEWRTIEPIRKLRQWIVRPVDDRGTSPGDERQLPDPDSAQVAYLQGVACEPRSAERARDRYRLALALNPRSFWIHYRLATVADRLARHQEVVDNLTWCLRVIPRNADLRAALAKGYIGLDDFDRAIEQCDEALRISSNNFTAQVNGWVARSWRDRTAMSKSDWMAISESDLEVFGFRDRPGQNTELAQRAILLECMAKPAGDSGLSDNSLGFRYDPAKIRGDDPDAHALRGFLFEHRGEREEARAEYVKTLEVHPGHLLALYRDCMVRIKIASPEWPKINVSKEIVPEVLAKLEELTSNERFVELVAENPDTLDCLDHLTFGLAQQRDFQGADDWAALGVKLARQYGGDRHLARAYYRQARLARVIANDPEGIRIESLMGPRASGMLARSPQRVVALESARKALLAWSRELLGRARSLDASKIDDLVESESIFHKGWYGRWLEEDWQRDKRQDRRSFRFAP